MARVLDSVVSTDTARRDEAETDCMLAMEAAAAVARDMAGASTSVSCASAGG